MTSHSVEIIKPDENVKEQQTKDAKAETDGTSESKVTSTPASGPFPDPNHPYYCPGCGMG